MGSTVPSPPSPSKLIDRAQLVRLTGPELTVTTEIVPTGESDQPSVAFAVWAAPDGTLFVASHPPPGSPKTRFAIHRRSAKTGLWDIVFEVPGSGKLSLFGRSASDMYAASEKEVVHFDGKTSSTVAIPRSERVSQFGDGTLRPDAVSVVGADLFLSGYGGSMVEIHRQRGAGWVREPCPPGLRSPLAFDGNWIVVSETSKELLLRRSPQGTWSPTESTLKPDEAAHAIWTSPTGETFFAILGNPLRFAPGLEQDVRLDRRGRRRRACIDRRRLRGPHRRSAEYPRRSLQRVGHM
jgi:hypothetical protein